MASSNLQTYTRMCEEGDFANDITNERSRQAMTAAFTPDFVIVVPPSLPNGGVWKGRDKWLEMNTMMSSLWRARNELEHVWDLPDDDVVILYSRKEWTAKATTRTVTFPAVEVLHFRDARICKVEMFVQDTKVILDALEPPR